MQLPSNDIGCHRTGFTKKCRALVAKGTCNRWRPSPGIEGKDSTGKPVPEYDCTDNYMLIAQMLGNQQMNQLGSAMESFRNVMDKHSKEQATATEVCVQSARAAIAVAVQSVRATDLIEQALPRPVNGSAPAQIAHQD